MTPDKYLTAALGIYALGVAIGDFYLEAAKVEFRRFGRALKIASTLCAALVALSSLFNPIDNINHGLVGLIVFVGLVFVQAFTMMYRLEGRGKLKPLDD
jgi:FtsH-binding integral membrane protein